MIKANVYVDDRCEVKDWAGEQKRAKTYEDILCISCMIGVRVRWCFGRYRQEMEEGERMKSNSCRLHTINKALTNYFNSENWGKDIVNLDTEKETQATPKQVSTTYQGDYELTWQ